MSGLEDKELVELIDGYGHPSQFIFVCTSEHLTFSHISPNTLSFSRLSETYPQEFAVLCSWVPAIQTWLAIPWIAATFDLPFSTAFTLHTGISTSPQGKTSYLTATWVRRLVDNGWFLLLNAASWPRPMPLPLPTSRRLLPLTLREVGEEVSRFAFESKLPSPSMGRLRCTIT